MLSALFGVKGKELLDERRLQGSADLVCSELEKAKFLSLAYRNDVELVFVLSKSGYHLQLMCDEPGLAKAKSVHLPGIIEVRFQKKKVNQVKLAKFSSGELVSSSICELRGKNMVWKMDDKARLSRAD